MLRRTHHRAPHLSQSASRNLDHVISPALTETVVSVAACGDGRLSFCDIIVYGLFKDRFLDNVLCVNAKVSSKC